MIGADGYRFFPASGFAEEGSGYDPAGQNVGCFFLSHEVPTFMPSHQLILTRRDVGEFEVSIFVSNRVIGVSNDEYLTIHPHMPAIALEAHQARG